MNVVELHEHQWCHPCKADIEGATFRMEWCLLCGTIRVNFHMGWSYMRPDGYREKVASGQIVEKDSFVGKVPDRVYENPRSPNNPAITRLGRGLKDLLEQQVAAPKILHLFPKPKKGGPVE